MSFTAANVSGTWIDNTLEAGIVTADYFVVLIVSIVVTMSILLHSFQMHHGSAYTSVRLQTEVGTFCQLCSSIFCLVCHFSTNPVKTAVMYNFLANGAMVVMVLLCDCYMFYDRLYAVVRIPRWKQTLVHCYIWILLVLPWFPAYTFVPIFYDTKNPTFTRTYYIATSFVSVAIVVYNFSITFEFTKILLKIYLPAITRKIEITAEPNSIPHTSSSSLAKIRSVSVNSVGHCLTSSIGVLFYSFVPAYGPHIESLIVVTGMHFWFNVKAGKPGDCCLLSNFVFPDSFFDSGCSRASEEQHENDLQPDKLKDTGEQDIRKDVDIGSEKDILNPNTAGQSNSSPVSIRPPSAVEPEDSVISRSISVIVHAGSVETDEGEFKYITDIIPRHMSSRNIVGRKSSSNVMRGIHRTSYLQSGKIIPFRSRMSGSSGDSKSNQRDEDDSQIGGKKKEEVDVEGEDEMVCIEEKTDFTLAPEKDTEAEVTFNISSRKGEIYAQL